MQYFRYFTVVLSAVFISLAFPISEASSASPFDKWKISCGADKGSIVRKGNVWTFKTSKNHCPGGIFNQRAEIFTESVSPRHKGTYVFESTLSLNTLSREELSLFSIHDGRRGCVPPFQLYTDGKGIFYVASDIKTGPGESCIRGKTFVWENQKRLMRDGTEQKLEIEIAFDGTGSFNFTVLLDGIEQLSDRYQSPTQKGAFRSKKFYFKHGAYSQKVFDYELISKDMKVTRQ